MEKKIPKLAHHHISETCGFLLPNPLEELPDYFHSWNYLSRNVGKLCQQKQMRYEVEKMPHLDHERLRNHREYRLAHLQLCFIGAGYIWQNGEKNAPRVIPKCLAVPWVKVSEHLGVHPVLSHVCFVLANWKPIDPERPLSPSNIECILHLTGGKDACIFIEVTAKMELIGTGALKGIVDSIQCVVENNVSGLKEALRKISKTIVALKEALSGMHEMDPNVFYNVLRPFLSGWKGDFIHKGGIIFEGANNNEPIALSGGSAAQSSLLQSIDAALGVKHDQRSEHFLISMRDYMPPPHREFIEELERAPSIRQYVEQLSDETLTEEYNTCLCKLRDFRSYHIQVVTRTVILMARKHKNDFETLSSKGTGGQDLVNFLKGIRNSTMEGQLKAE